MPKLSLLKMPRVWEDWLVMALGVAIALSPWVTRETGSQTVVVNAALAGLAIMMLAELDLVHARRWVVLGQIACGAWIAVSPFVLGYAGGGTLRLWHLSAGLCVLVLSGLELRKTWHGPPPREERRGAPE